MADIIDMDDLFGVAPGLPEEKPGKRQRGPSWGDRQRIERRKQDATIAAMYAAEEYIADIAEEVGLTPNAVSQRIQSMIQYWRKQSLKSITEKQAQHLAGLDSLEQELLAAWRESREGRLVNVSEKTKEAVKNMHRRKRRNGEARVSDPEAGPGGTANFKSKRYERLESSAGDPRYMALILDIRKERAKIWGLYAKGEGGPGSGGYDPESLALLSKEELMARFMTLFENVKLERARKLAGGVMVDISPQAMLTDGKPVMAHNNGNGQGDDDF